MTIVEAIRWSDNTADLKRNLAQGLDMIESTRQGAERMVQAMRGDKLIESAHKMTAAIAQLDRGVNALSPQEAARKLALLDKAMDKLSRTGRPIPTQMKVTADALKHVANEAQNQATLMQRADKALGLFGLSLRSLSIAGLATTATTMLVGLGKSAIAAASQLTDLSAQTGLSVQELQRLQFSGEQVGLSIDVISRAVNRLQDRLVRGDQGTVAAVNQLGLSLDNLKRMTPGAMFEQVARAVSQIESPTERAGLAMRLLGESGAQLLPLLTADLDELQQGFIGMSDAAVEAADKFDDMLAKFKLQAKGVAGEVFGTLAHFGGPGAAGQAMLDALRFFAPKLPTPQAPSLFGDQAATVRAADRTREFAAVTAAAAESLRKAEAEAQRLQQISDRMFGRDLIARATDYVGRLKDVRDITKMLPEQQAAVLEALDQAVPAYRALGQVAPDALIAVRNALRPLVDEHRLLANVSTSAYDLMLKIRNLGTKVSLFPQLGTSPLDLSPTLAAATKVNLTRPSLGRLIARDIGAGIKSFSSQLGQTVMDAITGGGSVGRSVGALAGMELGRSIAPRLTSGLLSAMGEKATSFGRGLATQLGAVLPAVGALLGQMLGGVIGWLFGPSWREQIRDWANEFAGGMDQLRDKLRALGDEGDRLWERLTGAGRRRKSMEDALKAREDTEAAFERLQEAQASAMRHFDALTGAAQRFGGVAPKALHPMIDGLLRINGLTQDMRDQLEALKGPAGIDRLREAAEFFGTTLDDLGQPLAQRNLNDTFDQIFTNFTVLDDATADSTKLFEAMADQVNEALDRARRMGLSIPAFMRPLLESMLKAGFLTDEFGNKLETLDGFTFSDDFKSTMDDIADRLERIALAFERIALAALPPRSADLEVSPEDRVAGPRSPTGQTTVVVQMNGQVMAKGVAPWLPGEVITMRLA